VNDVVQSTKKGKGNMKHYTKPKIVLLRRAVMMGGH
jgi:hypothetical protein